METHVVFDFSYCILGILLSFYVIYLVLRCTRNTNVRVYQKMLITSTVIDILYGCSTCFSLPNFLFFSNKLFILFENPYIPNHPTLLLIALQVQIFFVYLNILIVPIQFYFRYQVVSQRNYTFATILKPLFAAALYVFIHTIILKITFQSKDLVYDEMLMKEGFESNETKYMVGDIDKEEWLLFHMYNAIFISFITYFIVGGFYWLTQRRLRKIQVSLSESTKRAQRQVGRIATIQAVYPMLCICSPCLMISIAPLIGIKSQMFGYVCSTLSHIFPVLNALSVIICVPSYRRKTVRLIRSALGRNNEVTAFKMSSVTPNDGLEMRKEVSKQVLTRVEQILPVLAFIPRLRGN